jgi:hypothetical protein
VREGSGGRVQGAGFRVQIVVAIFVAIVVNNDYDNDYDNDGRPVDEYGRRER